MAGAVVRQVRGTDPVANGLDFHGTFLYAVDIGAFSSPGTIGDAVFTAEPTAGVTVTADNTYFGFGGVSFGPSPDDQTMSNLMQNIVWTWAPNPVTVNATGLTVGHRYRLQMFFYEACCDRGFDVYVEGTRIANDFVPLVSQGGVIDGTTGSSMQYSFAATDNTLNLVLQGPAPNPDNNPILDGFTLEDLGP
jgi:hypothetical protein